MDLVDNDDLFVVIVGDEETEDPDTEKQVLDIKCEVDETTSEIAVEDLIETAEKYGQSIDIRNVKHEVEDEVQIEYIDNQNDEDYIQDFSDEYSDDGYLSDKNKKSNPSTSKSKEMQRHKMRAPHEQQSFVNELRQEHPELAEDNEHLINTLCHIMLSTKRPPPPKDFFIMNNIMFECVVCGTKAETMPAVERHWQEKHGPRYLICYACGVDFRSTTNLYKHEKRCNAPDAVTVLKARARTLGRKARSRPFIVEPDPNLNLRTMKYNVQNKKRFPCLQCSAHFSTKQSLQSHELKHSGARPYRCRECPAAYTSACALSRHRVKHTDVQFICDDCGRSFKNKHALIVHLDTHKPLRKYPCEECGRRFAQKMARQLHVDRVHRHLPPPCACQVCPKRFPRMSLLKTHMLREHGMTLITRKMFFKRLPMLTETQLAQAKVVLKSDLGFNSRTQRTDHLTPSNTTNLDNQDYQEETTNDPNLSTELMHYMKKLSEGQIDSDSKYIVIQNGEAICVDGANIDFYKNNLITEVEEELEMHLDMEQSDEDNKDAVLRQIEMMIKNDNTSSQEGILCASSGVVVSPQVGQYT